MLRNHYDYLSRLKKGKNEFLTRTSSIDTSIAHCSCTIVQLFITLWVIYFIIPHEYLMHFTGFYLSNLKNVFTKKITVINQNNVLEINFTPQLRVSFCKNRFFKSYNTKMVLLIFSIAYSLVKGWP